MCEKSVKIAISVTRCFIKLTSSPRNGKQSAVTSVVKFVFPKFGERTGYGQELRVEK